jgi:hypothetical protein
MPAVAPPPPPPLSTDTGMAHAELTRKAKTESWWGDARSYSFRRTPFRDARPQQDNQDANPECCVSHQHSGEAHPGMPHPHVALLRGVSGGSSRKSCRSLL